MSFAALGVGLLLWVILALLFVAFCAVVVIYHSAGALKICAIVVLVLDVIALIVVLLLPSELF